MAADHTVRIKVVDNRTETCFLEPRAAIAHYETQAARFEIRLGCQGVHDLRDNLAASLGVPTSDYL